MTFFSHLQDCFNFTNLPTNYKLPFPDKILLLDNTNNNMDQAFIHMVLTDFPKLRDFHNGPPFQGPTAHFTNIMATSINASLVMSRHMRKDKCDNFTRTNFAMLHYPAFVDELSALLDKHADKPPVVQQDPIAFSYSYCNIPVPKLDGISPSKLFSTTADLPVWICILFALILVSLLIRLKIGENQPVLVATLSALISAGISGDTKPIQRSGLFTLWTVTCLLFVIYYSGGLTSVVISPTPEDRMTKIIELQENNYSILFAEHVTHYMVSTSVKVREGAPHQEQSTLKKLLESVIIAPTRIAAAKMLATEQKQALISVWQATIYYLNRAKEYLSEHKIAKRRCYLGEELVLPENIYFVAAPPDGHKLMEVTRFLIEAGIHSLWLREVAGIAASPRVQDRSKMRSPTKLLQEVQLPEPLELMDGMLRNVFVLWAICLVFAGVAFIVEKLWKRNDKYFDHFIPPIESQLQ